MASSCWAFSTRRPAASTTCRNRSPLSFTCAVRSKAAAARTKLVADKFTRQAISKTPGVIVAPLRSRIASAGATLPICGPCHQRRTILISPLMVRTCATAGLYSPAACPSSDGAEGGKAASAASTRFCTARSKTLRRISARKVAHLFFAAGDPLAVRRVVDGLHHLLGELLELSASSTRQTAAAKLAATFPSRAPCVLECGCKPIRKQFTQTPQIAPVRMSCRSRRGRPR